MKFSNRLIIIGRRSIIEHLFEDKNHVHEWTNIDVNDLKNVTMVGYSFSDWFKHDETLQIRWDFFKEVNAKYKLKIVWLRSPFANGKNNKYVMKQLLELQNNGVIHNPSIDQMYNINSKRYFVNLPPDYSFPNTISYHIVTKNNIKQLVKNMDSILKYYKENGIKYIRVKKGFSAHGKDQYVINSNKFNIKQFEEYISTNVGNGNTIIFQKHMKDYITKSKNMYSKLDFDTYGYSISEYRFFILNGKVYPKVVTGRYPNQKWIAYDPTKETNKEVKSKLLKCMSKVELYKKWYYKEYKSYPLLLRIDVVYYNDNVYLSEFETESGLGPITCIGLGKQCPLSKVNDFFDIFKTNLDKFMKSKNETTRRFTRVDDLFKQILIK